MLLVNFLVRLWEPLPLKSNYRIKSVPGFEGSYLIDTDGVAWTLKDAANRDDAIEFGGRRWRRMAPRPQSNGYLRVSFCRAGVIQDYLLHSVVLTAFIGPRPAGNQAAHNNGVRHDNRLENLRWATIVDNHADKRKHGTHIQGSAQWNARLTDESVMEIRRRYAAGECSEVLASCFGIRHSQVSRIVRGQQWKHLPVIRVLGKAKQRGATSQYIGVTWNKKRQKWRAYISVDGREKSSLHAVEYDAAIARDLMALQYMSPGTRMNFPTGQLSGAETAPH